MSMPSCNGIYDEARLLAEAVILQSIDVIHPVDHCSGGHQKREFPLLEASDMDRSYSTTP